MTFRQSLTLRLWRVVISEDASPMSEFTKTRQSPRSPGLRDSKSAPSLESSISPLQQILSYTSLRQTSSVDDIMRATTAGGKCGRSSISRRLTYTANDFGRSPWSASGVEQTASTTLHYAAGYDGTGGGNPLPFTRHSTEPCSRKRNVKDNCFAGMDPKMYNDTIIYNSMCNVLDNAGGLKTPKRRGIGPVTTSFGACFANKSPLLPVLPPSSPKRLQQRTWSEATVPKQRRCWPVSNNNNNNNTNNNNNNNNNNNICVLNLSNHQTNGSFVTSSSVTTGASQPEARRASKTSKERRGTAAEPRVVAATHGSKAARRSPVSSWSADDVHAFVLSTPHGSLYAKVSDTQPLATCLRVRPPLAYLCPEAIFPNSQEVEDRFVQWWHALILLSSCDLHFKTPLMTLYQESNSYNVLVQRFQQLS